jgi:hypothetical protein
MYAREVLQRRLPEESLAETQKRLQTTYSQDDEALFKDPPAKGDCPICFLPMPHKLLACISFPPATIISVPISDYAEANDELAKMDTEEYYSCCRKSICGGCVHSFRKSGNDDKCPFCNADQDKTDEEAVEEVMKWVEANMPEQCVNWAVIITMEMVYNRIVKRHWNFMLGQLNLVPVRRIFTYWVAFIIKGGI